MRVADRWHLWHNLSEAAERCVADHRECLRGTAPESPRQVKEPEEPDTRTNVTVQPGCCCGLEDWREWLDVADGETLWLGHDPSPRLEHADEIVQLWPDSVDAQETSSGQPIEIVVGDLPGILHTVQEGLQGFLSLTKQWATRHVPTLAEDLAARLDEDLAISAPLPGTSGQHAP